jgi:hypothetical protein
LISLLVSPRTVQDITNLNSLKSKLNIGHYNGISVRDSSNTETTRLATTNISGDKLIIKPGTNMIITAAGGSDTIISATGQIIFVNGSGSSWTGTITGMTTNVGLNVGSKIKVTADVGSIGDGNPAYGSVTVTSILSSGTQITFSSTVQPVAGTVTNIRTESNTSETGALTFVSNTVLSTDTLPTFISKEYTGISATGTEVFYGTTGNNTNRVILNTTKLNITDAATTPVTSGVLHKEMISVSPLGPTISTATVTAASGRTSQKYLAGVNFVESIYGNSYKLRVQDYNGTTAQLGDLSLEADVVNITATNNINFAGVGPFINLGNKTINTGSIQFKLATSSGTEMEILCNNGVNSGQFANFTMTNATTFKINLSSGAGTSVLTTTANGTGQTLTSTGTITINATTTFTPGTTINFTSCTVNGLPAGADHALTHQSVTSEIDDAVPTEPTGSDAISAWQVGAVARAEPVLLNKIAIAISSGFYDQSVAFNDTQLYGASGGVASAYSTLFTAGNTNVGPMYVVLANGQESNLTSIEAKGPPGQIIMIRKV